MTEPRNHMGRTALAILPFGLLCLAGWLAEWIGRGAGWLDAACWRGMHHLERWVEPEERSDG